MVGLSKIEDYANIKVGVVEYPNHRKYIPHHRVHKKTACYFEPHRDLIKQMQKQERNHQTLTNKHTHRLEDESNEYTAMPVVLLARLEKKWNSLSKKLRKRLGV